MASSAPMHIESLSPSQFDAAIALWHDAGLTRRRPSGPPRPRAWPRDHARLETWLAARDVPQDRP